MKKGFTLIECVISIMIATFILTGSFVIMRDVKQGQFKRDQMLISMADNISAIETLKSSVKDISDLCDYMQLHPDFKLIQVGVGEVELEKNNNTIIIKKVGGYETALVYQIKAVRQNLFRVVIGDMQCVVLLKEGY